LLSFLSFQQRRHDVRKNREQAARDQDAHLVAPK